MNARKKRYNNVLGRIQDFVSGGGGGVEFENATGTIA